MDIDPTLCLEFRFGGGELGISRTSKTIRLKVDPQVEVMGAKTPRFRWLFRPSSNVGDALKGSATITTLDWSFGGEAAALSSGEFLGFSYKNPRGQAL